MSLIEIRYFTDKLEDYLGELKERIRKLEESVAKLERRSVTQAGKSVTELHSEVLNFQRREMDELIKQFGRLESESLALVRQSSIDTKCLGDLVERIRKLEQQTSAPQPPQPPQPQGMTALQALQWCAANVGKSVWDSKGQHYRVMQDGDGYVYISGRSYVDHFHKKYEPYTTEPRK